MCVKCGNVSDNVVFHFLLPSFALHVQQSKEALVFVSLRVVCVCVCTCCVCVCVRMCVCVWGGGGGGGRERKGLLSSLISHYLVLVYP